MSGDSSQGVRGGNFAPTHLSARGGIAAAAAASVVTLLTTAFEPAIANWPSSFVLLIILPLVSLLLIGCGLWALTQLLLIRSYGWAFALPFLICAATLLLVLFAPLQQPYLRHDFSRLRAEREHVVALVARGELTPNVADDDNLIALGDREPRVAVGNNIVIERSEDGSYVLFPTTRGLERRFTGFLHTPPDADPNDFFEFDDEPPKQIVPYGEDWYFVAR